MGALAVSLKLQDVLPVLDTSQHVHYLQAVQKKDPEKLHEGEAAPCRGGAGGFLKAQCTVTPPQGFPQPTAQYLHSKQQVKNKMQLTTSLKNEKCFQIFRKTMKQSFYLITISLGSLSSQKSGATKEQHRNSQNLGFLFKLCG